MLKVYLLEVKVVKVTQKHNENDVVLRLPKFKILNLKKDK